MDPFLWKHGPTPAVCPVGGVLSHICVPELLGPCARKAAWISAQSDDPRVDMARVQESKGNQMAVGRNPG